MKRTEKKSELSWREAAKLNVRAFRLLFHRYPQMILSRLFYVVWTALSPYVGIYLAARVVDELAGERQADRLLLLVGLTLGAAALISLVTAILSKWKEAQAAGLPYKVDHIFAEKLFSMDYIDLDKAETGELLSTIRQNQNGAGWGLYRMVSRVEKLIFALFTVLGGIALTVTLFSSRVPESAGGYAVLNHPLFVVLLIAVMLAITFLSPALSNLSGSFWAKHADAHRFGNRLFGFFGSLGHNKELAPDVRMYRQDLICERYNTNKEDTFCSAGLFARYTRGRGGLLLAASAAVSVVFTGLVYAFVCLKAWAGAFGVGAVTQYVASVSKVADGVSGFFGVLGDMRNNAVFLRQIFAFLDIPNEMYQGSLTTEKRSDGQYEIEFKDVSFRYPGSEAYALRHVNLKFQVGKRLAVVGRNGSGKTTFIKLLCRLYDPTEGEILLNGIDIRKYNYLDYMSVFSVVFQDFKLFSLKLGENVAGAVRYDEEKVKSCLVKAGFGDRLASLPDGLDTYLYQDCDKRGISVSGGEAQKIAIARALCHDAPFIILDEPTAALDAIAEAEIYSKFDEIVGDKTAIYISHRLSSCKFCDEILVFDGGEAVQKGTHAQLVADEAGLYYALWNAQAQYYTE